MIRIYLAAVDLIPAAVVLVPLFLIFYGTAYEKNLRKSAYYCVFCLYLSAVFSLVGIPNVTYFRPEANLNLIPFAGIVADIKNSILNVMLFVPLGLFLPVLWEQFRKLHSAVVFGFSMSLVIELLQLLTYRATDVNDLITNSLGTAVGYLLSKSFACRHPAIGKGKWDVYGLWALSFSVMFFIHPFLSPMIWDRIL